MGTSLAALTAEFLKIQVFWGVTLYRASNFLANDVASRHTRLDSFMTSNSGSISVNSWHGSNNQQFSWRSQSWKRPFDQ